MVALHHPPLPDWATALGAWLIGLHLQPPPYRQGLATAARLAGYLKLSKGALSKMPNLMTLVPVAIKFVTLAYQIEQVENNPDKDAPTKRAEVLALLPQLEPLIDAGAGLPAGTVEKYLTPGALALLYDGAVYAERLVTTAEHP